MKYNLQKFDEVIAEILSEKENQFGSDAELFSLNDQLKIENIQIERKIRETVFRLKSNSKIEHYIHKQQLALENLIAFVRREINPGRRKELYEISEQNNQKDKLKIVYIKLEKLQIFLEDDFAIYLSADRIVPFRSFSKKRKSNKLKIDGIRKSKTSAQLSLELMEIICRQNNLNYGYGITYHKFRYNNKFISELSLHLSKHKGIIYDDAIILFLLEMNYNTKSFFKFLMNQINGDLDKFQTAKEKFDFLTQIVKTYKQIDIYGKTAYKRKRIHICKQILNWLEQEIKFLSRNQVLLASDSQFDNRSSKYKLKVNMSVAQLSCFFCFLCKIGILKPKSNEHLFSFLSENFETNHTENISLNSISNKFYNIDDTSKDAVRNIIIRLLNISK